MGLIKSLLAIWVFCLAFSAGCDSNLQDGSVTSEVTTGEPDSPIRILAWNIESDGSDTQVIISQLKQDMPKFDIVALSEVPSSDIQTIADEIGWSHLGGSLGGNDRLMIAWSNRFENMYQFELRVIGGVELPAANNPSPIFVHLKDRQTNNEFIVMNNHLARGNEDCRNKQAELLVEWARPLNTAAIAVGDYNMDFDFHTQKGNKAFELFQTDGVWKWIKPHELVDTNWSDPDNDGKDNYPDSMLDFAFVAGPGKRWNVTSEVVVWNVDFPDDESTSDHRPVITIVHP